MRRVKTILRVGGIVIAAIGVLCLPLGFGVSPRRDLSFFNNLSDLGAFVGAGLALIALGLIAFGLSSFVRAETDD
jgi:hypothetical protein